MLKEFLQSPYVFIGLGFLFAICICALLLPQILLISHKKKLYDLPDERKVHDRPVPRLGGLAFMPAIFVAFSLVVVLRLRLDLSINAIAADAALMRFLVLLTGMVCFYCIGLADDIVGLSYRKKLVGQILVGVLFSMSTCAFNNLYGFLWIHQIPLWVGIPLTIFTIIYITNAINLIDGIDGLASGLCALALTAFVVLFTYEQQYYNALVAACSLGVIIPFLYSNLLGSAGKGNKLFMGDTGSLTLGLILSYLAISACRMSSNVSHDKLDAVIAFSILFIPLIDVVRVVVHRLRHGRNPFLPDSNHFHHKLLRTGLRPRGVLLFILGYCLFFFALNVLLVHTLNFNLTWVVFLDLLLWTASQIVITMIGNQRNAQ